MPYPLEKLKYGLRQRLRELATRSEAYAFQIAAPNYSGFQPIQKLQSVDSVSFSIDEENNLHTENSDRHAPKNLDEMPLYVASYELIVEKFNPNNNVNVVFDDYRLAPKIIYFYECVFDAKFIQYFFNAVQSPLKYLKFHDCTFTFETFASVVCNHPVFRSLKSFGLMCPTSVSTWIEALTEAECTFLEEFSLIYVPPSVFDIVNKEGFFKFFNAQCKGFKMGLEVGSVADFQNMKERFEAQFSEKFKINNRMNTNSPKKRVCIEFHGSPYQRVIYTFRAD